MALQKITQTAGRGVYVEGDDIDTDRIIPARFMKCVTFDGLGEYAFYDERKKEDGSDKPHALNEKRFEGATILLSGSNFGCGSSREHAPQALYRFGIRAVIAESFAEIFFGNSITLGMPCVVLESGDIRAIADLIDKDPAVEVIIDLTEKKVTVADMDFRLLIPDHAHEGLTTGKWDAIADLLEGVEAVKTCAGRLPYMAAS
ncbi:MAG: 3-isopropylmalate dehydratase small subunit [Chthoniobacterales bacterium]